MACHRAACCGAGFLPCGRVFRLGYWRAFHHDRHDCLPCYCSSSSVRLDVHLGDRLGVDHLAYYAGCVVCFDCCFVGACLGFVAFLLGVLLCVGRALHLLHPHLHHHLLQHLNHPHHRLQDHQDLRHQVLPNPHHRHQDRCRLFWQVQLQVSEQGT